MTDIEITRLCAEAMELRIDEQTTASIGYREQGHIWTRNDDLIGRPYRPLHDDAQAMALVKKIKLTIHWSENLDARNKQYQWSINEYWEWKDDLNRAICECVARMQQAKEKP